VKPMARRVQIRIKRAYEEPGAEDGARYLVDGLWPRGRKKADLALDGWLKDVAPSKDLRQWFGHDASRWEEFQKRYSAELDAKPDAWKPILDAAKQGTVTLLFAAKDERRNNAVALKRYLEAKGKATGHGGRARKP